MYEALQPDAQGDARKVEARHDPNLLQVRADTGKMKQVFLNLLLNAQDGTSIATPL